MTIILASLDPVLTKLQKRVLEVVGYRVIVIDSVAQIASECRSSLIDLVLIGSSLSPEEKRKFWTELRNYCGGVVLELYDDGSQNLWMIFEPTYTTLSHQWILSKPFKRSFRVRVIDGALSATSE